MADPGTGQRQVSVAIAAGVIVVGVATAMLFRSGGGRSVHRAFPAPGQVVDVLKEEGLKVNGIRDFVIGADDTMFLAVDDEKHRSVISVTRTGHVSTILRDTGKDGVSASAMVLGATGELFVADGAHGRVIARARNGKLRQLGSFLPASGTAEADPGLDGVGWMALDPATGDLYLADRTKIDRLDSKGVLSTVAGDRHEYKDRSEFPPDTFLPDRNAPRSGPAKDMRFFLLGGLAFNSDAGSLYVTSAGSLVRIERNGTAEVVAGDIRFQDGAFYDPTRKNLYVGAESATRDGIARVNQQGDVLVLSGTEGATNIADHTGIDSRGNMYWLHKASSSLAAAGDALSETRVDLKGRASSSPALKSPAGDGKAKELFDAKAIAKSLGEEVVADDIGPFAAGRDGTVYFAINESDKTLRNDRLIAVPRSGKPEILDEHVFTRALAVSDDGTLYATQIGPDHHALNFKRPGDEWHAIVDYKQSYGVDTPGPGQLREEATSIGVDEVSKDIYLGDGHQITRLDAQGRLTLVAGVARAATDPPPGELTDGTPAKDALLDVENLAVDVTSHDLYIQNGRQLLRMTSDGIIHAMKEPSGLPSTLLNDGLAFDPDRHVLIGRSTATLESLASVSPDGRVTPVTSVGPIDREDVIWVTSDGAVYSLSSSSGKVRYFSPAG